jgi:intein-encoded DNA endonuclease-like protein
MMDERLQKIFDSLPPEKPRSCLEPYNEFIFRLLETGRSYRRVRQILEEHCGLKVSEATVVYYVQRRMEAMEKKLIAQQRAQQREGA